MVGGGRSWRRAAPAATVRYAASVFRPWLRVARPDDWPGNLARLVTGLVITLLVLGVLLGRIPESWSERVWGYDAVIRVILVGVVLYVGAWGRALVYSALPSSVVLAFGRLRLSKRAPVRAVRLGDIASLAVERRPGGEVFVLGLRDGTEFDLCPVRWDGAGRVYQRIARNLRRVGKKVGKRGDKPKTMAPVAAPSA
jgi:hypothetical protein